MRKSLRTILKVLDGQPTGRKGQSLVEMALTTPILVLMVLGLTEIGFLANNYLIIMDAVRTGARAAVNVDSTIDPVRRWPAGEARNFERLDCDADPDWHTMLLGSEGSVSFYGHRNQNDLGPSQPPELPRAWNLKDPPYNYDYYRDPTPPNDIIEADPSLGFYDSIACQVIQAMSPLILNEDDDPNINKDDVVVSVVSYARMDYTTALSEKPKVVVPSIPADAKSPWVTVTGRWPTENRFCFLENSSTGAWEAGDERDPFDYLNDIYDFGFNTGASDDNSVGPFGPYNQRLFEEPNSVILNPTIDTDSQGVRGFVFSGKNRNADDCYGSRFTVQEIEKKLNLDLYNENVPNGGVVIIEVFWQHHPLFFGPIFSGYTNDRTKDPVLHIWTFFPFPAAEPTATPPQP